jgi:hypothetical protein
MTSTVIRTFALLTVLATLSACAAAPIDTATADTMMAADPETPMAKTWATSGKLTTGGTGLGSGQPVTLQADNLDQLDYSYYTVMFDISSAVGSVSAVANVLWTVNGNQMLRQVSVGSGVEISGPASSIKVIVSDNTNANINTAGQVYSVTIAIAPGTRVSTSQPLLQDPGGGVYHLVAHATVNVPVPSDCGVIGMWISAATGAGITPDVSVIEQTTATVAAYQFGLDRQEPIYVPIVPGTASIFVDNLDAVNNVNVSIVFAIDG